MKYKTKPVIVEAYKWSGFDTYAPDWFQDGVNKGVIVYLRKGAPDGMLAIDDSGIANLGDYLVQEPNGHILIISEKLFARTYEVLADPVQHKIKQWFCRHKKYIYTITEEGVGDTPNERYKIEKDICNRCGKITRYSDHQWYI